MTFWLFLAVFLCGGLCQSEESDLGYGLNIGNAIDVFANYGDLSQVTQVVSADYEEENAEHVEPFREKNIRLFLNISSRQVSGDTMIDMNILLCETFDDLLATYFENFRIEGTDKPWKAFLGDWILDEIMRAFGIEYDTKPDNCCYVLVKLMKVHKSVQLDSLDNVVVKDYVKRAIDKLNVSDASDVRRFMKSYGTHYIDSYVTGNFIYQVFKYKRTGYNLLRAYIRQRNMRQSSSDNLRFYFSSYFLKQVGEIRIASGNKTVETWAKTNLRDSQYLYSRPSLLRLHYNPILAFKLNDLLDNGALLGLGLKTLRPLFKDRRKADMFAEIVENDMKLWEVNA
ncbi:PREDICTED: torso-like protein [Papilio xuthus]|uniref:Torso-like protein n=1 Tax=Papilio xuthus TaxID=66420 RepID=A0A194PXW2_PAPXU|nr:PREDICTED: torso-like protein [Papilio xuthus]KPI98181.1 Torso-like protein [Papilio xuthus]